MTVRRLWTNEEIRAAYVLEEHAERRKVANCLLDAVQAGEEVPLADINAALQLTGDFQPWQKPQTA